MASMERQHFWGCTLTKDKPEVKWLGTNGEDNSEIDILNQLALSQACLGIKAKDTAHVVQVTTTGVNSNTITQPIVVLGSGVKQIQCRLEFSGAATFKLIEGHGPVHLAGSHIQVLSSDFEESGEEESEDEEISSGKQLPMKGTKTALSPPKKEQPPAKKAKLELENDVSDDDEEEEDSDEEDDDDDDEVVELIPLKDKKSKEKLVAEKAKTPQKPTAPEKKGKSNLLGKEAEEGSEESDEMEDEEDDEEDDDDEDFEEGESEEDEQDEDSEEDEDESEDGSDDDITNAILAKNKLRVQQNGKTPQKKAPAKKTPEPKTPEAKKTEKKTPEKKTPNKGGATNASSPDIASVKQKLLKSPNLPKKIDKFKNFMKTNMRVTEDKVVQELWTWLQKNKK